MINRNQYCGARRVVKNTEINTAIIVAVTEIYEQYIGEYCDISKQLTLSNTKKVLIELIDF